MTAAIAREDLFAYAMSEFLKNNFEKSIELLNDVLKSDPHNKLGLVTRGTAYLKTKSPDPAIEDFSRALSLDPQYARACHLRALARELKGDHEGALEDLRKAIELNPGYGAAYQSRAALFAKLGQEDSAAEDIQMIAHLTHVNIESFANANNVWRSNQLRVEEMLESELTR
jgi:tetratricopeptide (TPR) repeat protein